MIKHVIYNSDNSYNSMASWYSYIIYDERVYTYPSRNCYHCNFNKINTRKEITLDEEIE